MDIIDKMFLNEIYDMYMTENLLYESYGTEIDIISEYEPDKKINLFEASKNNKSNKNEPFELDRMKIDEDIEDFLTDNDMMDDLMEG